MAAVIHFAARRLAPAAPPSRLWPPPICLLAPGARKTGLFLSSASVCLISWCFRPIEVWGGTGTTSHFSEVVLSFGRGAEKCVLILKCQRHGAGNLGRRRCCLWEFCWSSGHKSGKVFMFLIKKWHGLNRITSNFPGPENKIASLGKWSQVLL